MAAMDWISDGEAVALGWTLLHFCWQGTAVALLYAGIDKLTSSASVKVRYVIAVVALALMPTLVVATLLGAKSSDHTITYNGQRQYGLRFERDAWRPSHPDPGDKVCR